MATVRPVVLPASQARRLFMRQQGLLRDPAGRATADSLRALIERLGFVQIDSINMIERAHHLTLQTRLENYRPKLLARLLERDRQLFENWTHDASAIPSAWFPHWKHRFHRAKERIRANRWWRERVGANADRVIEEVRGRIERDGPLMSRDFADDAPGESGPWWGWKPQKAVLEYLWRTGELAIAGRVNFQKVYDLTERVLPEVAKLEMPDEEAHVDWACRSALERLGVAGAAEIAGFWRAVDLPGVRAWCRSALQRGEIVELSIEVADGSKPQRGFALPDFAQMIRTAPDPPEHVRLLSPFDPVIRDRKRLRRWFNFDYRFEAFVPAAQRRFGYYVLPVLEGDRFIGRLDGKFDRAAGELRLNRIWAEPGERFTKTRLASLDEALERLAALIGAERWTRPKPVRIDAGPVPRSSGD